ncbi:hypothetical protein HS048_28150 [Planomonospora sp. ID91781]|uniref:Uncharacterized protein n=1 Tax=Planomonospora sphaerica TaxID=161355 RepID=A0A171DFA3_9ACTN|nr:MULTISPECIES: hypothetical protein [Planomonospora]MBG0824584.1 hypothetical protein [Planomonospora sp. ID91781]GAT68219.1 hypothetical protein PS9374_03880 [Planomonospora sphaerica]
MLTLILLIFALACFLLAAFGIGGARINLLALGLALWVLSELVPRIGDL